MNVLLIDPHLESSELYQELCSHEIKVHVTGHESEATEYMRKIKVDLIIMRYFLAEITGVKLAGYYRKTYPDIPVVIVSEEPDLKKWKESTQVKATFMPLPLDLRKFKQLFLKRDEYKPTLSDREENSEVEYIQSKTEKEDITEGEEPTILNNTHEENEENLDKVEEMKDIQEAYDKETRNNQIEQQKYRNQQKHMRRGKYKKKREKDRYEHEATIITIFSPKGGVGKTTTAVNLATILKTDLDLRTVILEFTRQTGNVLGHFQLNPTLNIRDWLERSTWPTEDELEDMLLWCPTTELAILPTQPLLDEDTFKINISPEDCTAIIDCLSPYFDCIVIDGGTIMDDVLFHLLDISDQVVMVSKIERETLQDCHYVPIMLERRDIDDSKVVHVLNQAKKGLGMTFEDALAHVGIERNHVIHYDREIEKIPVEKEPFIIRGNKKGRYNKELWELASMLIEHPEFEDEPNKGMLDKLMFWKGA